jgi:hypothetical protein
MHNGSCNSIHHALSRAVSAAAARKVFNVVLPSHDSPLKRGCSLPLEHVLYFDYDYSMGSTASSLARVQDASILSGLRPSGLCARSVADIAVCMIQLLKYMVTCGRCQHAPNGKSNASKSWLAVLRCVEGVSFQRFNQKDCILSRVVSLSSSRILRSRRTSRVRSLVAWIA